MNETGINKNDIKQFIYNSKNLNENLTFGEAKLKDNSEIFVVFNKKIELISFIFIREINDNNPKKIKIDYLKFYENSKFSYLINKYKKVMKYYEGNVVFIFNNKRIEKDSNIKNVGLINNSKIFVYIVDDINITFKINKMEGSGCPINIECKTSEYCSELIDCYFKKISFSYRNKISKFIFNSKELDKNTIIINSGIKNNSIIYVDLKEPQQKISIIIKHEKEEKKIDCLNFYLLTTLIDQYYYETSQ